MSWSINFFSRSDVPSPVAFERLDLEITTLIDFSLCMIKLSYQVVQIAFVQEFERAEALV